MINSKIFGIIVSYNPVISDLLELCKVLIQSDINVLVIDNTEEENYIFDEFIGINNLRLVRLWSNDGIATAQNVGIKLALEQGAESVVFFDQDSVINKEFLFSLLAPMMRAEVMVSAPMYVDKISNVVVPIDKVNYWGILNRTNRSDFDIADNYLVISSGMAVKREVFEVVGMMNEDYFIDYVDTDFCFRCFSKSIRIHIVKDAHMYHSVGEGLLSFLGFYFFVHNEIRVYYQARNSILFIKKIYVPLMFKIREFISILFHHGIVLVFLSSNRRLYLRALYFGFRDGLIGRIGKVPLNLL